MKQTSRRKKWTIFLVVLVFLFGDLYFENNCLKITEHKIFSDKIPQGFSGYKIAQISDYHNTRSRLIQESLENSLQQEAPDLIVLTGDLVDSRRTDMDEALELIEILVELAPVYYVTGNHESRLEDYADLEYWLKAKGVIVLANESVELVAEDGSGETIVLAGVHDPAFDTLDGLDREQRTMARNLNRIIEAPGNDADWPFTVLLSHRPELLETYVAFEMDLVLTGHAHGGQIRLPFIGGVIAPGQGLFPAYTSGVIKEGETQMTVSRGVGNSLAPFRINNRPELVYVTLQ